MSRIMFIVVMTLLFCRMLYAGSDIASLEKAIARTGAKWTARENWTTRISPEEQKRLCGAQLHPPEHLKDMPLITLITEETLPAALDWRNSNGNWVTPPRNQRDCGSCWDFSVLGQVEAWWKIYHKNPQSDIDLSEQFLLSCGEGSCEGGSLAGALEFIKNVGVPPESCMPYAATDTIQCEQACTEWADEAITIPGWGWVTQDEIVNESIKKAVLHHPVSATMTVYQDFMSYGGGVYEYITGDNVGGHAILIIGWNDNEQSWICKNSWGTGWGERGFFRIKWNNCGIGKNIPFIWDEMTSGIVIEPESIDVSLLEDDSSEHVVSISNLGPETLEFFVIDYEIPVVFYPDRFMAWDDYSWWCADPEIGGYENHWLQYLETPVLNISGTQNPQLSLMGSWQIEEPDDAESPWDGWDGWNVWVSTDGGSNFRVATPSNLPYDRQSLWSFGDDEQGWDMGPGIPGWVGRSDGWIPIRFDLSPYICDNLVIRFAFASDMGFCTHDDSSMHGLFLDEIEIHDGSNIILADHGDKIGTMNRLGFGKRPADWMAIENDGNIVAPHAATDIHFRIDTHSLLPGNYRGTININSNDSGRAEINIPVELLVLDSPQRVPVSMSADVPQKCYLVQNYPNPFNSGTSIGYLVHRRAKISLKIFNLLGHEVRNLIDRDHGPGYYALVWDGNKEDGAPASSGVYFCVLSTDEEVYSRKLLLLR